MTIHLIRTFIPSKDWMVSKKFYLGLGFELIWQGDDLIEFGTSSQNFFLQNHYVKEWADNCMMQLFTDDLDALYDQAKSLIDKFKGSKIGSIFSAPYGRTFHLIDPAGVLWHMTEYSREDSGES